MPDRVRNTDRDWVKIGVEDPYWGVLSDDRYTRPNINDATISEFYQSGQSEIDAVVGKASELFGQWKTPTSALDFGCGVGRLSFAMMKWSSSVTGYDISPGMLKSARDRFKSTSGLQFTQEFPVEPFDWINSFIVFQHIPPIRGLNILEKLLGLLSQNGIVTLHFTLYRDAALVPPKSKLRAGMARAMRRMLGRPVEAPVGSISMFDYDLGAIIQRLNAHGIDDLRLIHTNHGGHHGAHIIGRRGR
jgi:SAM-dependent methyltransferase